jgi:hypothetical protein
MATNLLRRDNFRPGTRERVVALLTGGDMEDQQRGQARLSRGGRSIHVHLQLTVRHVPGDVNPRWLGRRVEEAHLLRVGAGRQEHGGPDGERDSSHARILRKRKVVIHPDGTSRRQRVTGRARRAMNQLWIADCGLWIVD